jgi:hypothetical protein
MANIKFYAPSGVSDATLSDGIKITVASGYATADSKYAPELMRSGWTPATEDGVTATVASGATVLAAGGGVVRSLAGNSTIAASNQEPFRNHATSAYIFIGYDAVAATVYVNDTTGGRILRGTSSDSWTSAAGVTWSTSLPYPTDVTYLNLTKLIRFKGYLYLVATATTGSLVGIWRALPTAGNTTLSWSSSPMLSFASLATCLFTDVDADDSYLYAAEYTSQTTFTPKAYRSADGVTWEIIINESVPGVVRHFHAITPDPYNPGHVYITCGDGIAKTIQRSKDYGTTWSVLIASSTWQAVQISFTDKFVYFAADSQNGFAWKMDRDALVPMWISPGLWKNIPVITPAALTDTYYGNAWYGVVDPATGDFYSTVNDASAGGNTPGIFLIREGQAPVLCIKPPNIMSPIQIAGGVLWVGLYRKILNAY